MSRFLDRTHGRPPTTESLDRYPTPRDSTAAPLAKSSSSVSKIPPSHSSQGALVVDDVKLYREILRRWLTEADYDVSVAAGGDSAWELFLQHRPRLVVTDIDMTAGNGFELISRIRESDLATGMHTHVAVMSSLRDDEIERFTQSVGADGFLAKPLAKSATMGLITDLLVGVQNQVDHLATVSGNLDTFAVRRESLDNGSQQTSPVLRRIAQSLPTTARLVG